MAGIAEPAEHIVEFFLYVMPGFVALQFYRAKYPAKQLSDSLQVAWSLNLWRDLSCSCACDR